MIKNQLVKNAKKIDKFLINYLKKQDRSLLVNPMKYGVLSGGKKIRSTVILSAGKIFDLDQNKLINTLVILPKIFAVTAIIDIEDHANIVILAFKADRPNLESMKAYINSRP